MVAGEEEGKGQGQVATLQLEPEKICQKVTSWKFSLQNQVRQANVLILILSDLTTATS